MRVGSLIFATEQGLGYLARDFYTNGIVTDPLVVHHGSRPTQDWYPGVTILKSRQLNGPLVHRLICEVDLMLFFETPFEWGLLNYCRKVGTPSVLIPMHECTPDPLPSHPDLLLCPSHLDYDCYRESGVELVYLPIPVTAEWRLRRRAKVFVHNAGNGGLLGRNGTRELLEAIPLVRSPAKFLIRSQVPIRRDTAEWEPGMKALADHRVSLQIGSVPFEQLYDGDVFVFPEKFNGLSLPLQEAFVSGMAVMCSRRYPMTEWLPNDPMIPVQKYKTSRISPRHREFQEAVISPEDVAATIDCWYDQDITELSLMGQRYGQQNSWECLGPRYKMFFQSLAHYYEQQAR